MNTPAALCLSAHAALRHARDFIKSQKGEIALLPLSEEELNPTPQEDHSYLAVPLEDTTHCIPVNYKFPADSKCSELSFFEDGRQRTIQIGYIQTKIGSHQVILPIHFFVVAAVILVREKGELKVWQAPDIESGILVPKELVPDQSILSEFENMGLPIIDTKAIGNDYYQLRQRALYESKDQRLAAENRLIERWRHSDDAQDHFLVVDGTLMNLRNEDNVERCIGVSKSFGVRYFDTSAHNLIRRMKEFERSWTFRFHNPDDSQDDSRLGMRERISWYLRLRSRPNVDPEFGLIRVEISQRHVDQAKAYAERFSRSLLSERLPTSYPKPRWDKHLYPIHACEEYLSSVMPSTETINSSMKG